jgi:D-alanyl-D-alanine carboxypeptidase/D-alanyl-D-alanine-endopeptidase (penicillin-binding protein 4)
MNTSRLRGVVVATVLAVSVAVTGLAVVGRDRIAGSLGVTDPVWRPGVPLSAPPVLNAASAGAQPPTEAGLTSVLRPLLADPALGAHTAVSVLDVVTGQPLFNSGADTPSIPASTAKLVTAATALTARDPAYRLKTRAVAGTEPGDVVLVGAGDPTLAGGNAGTYPDAARLPDLAVQVKTALGDTPPARVLIDTSLFEGPVFSPGWDPDIPTGGNVAAITALMTDGARVDPTRTRGGTRRYPQPELAAGQAFATALGIPGRVSVGKAADGARELGSVESPPLIRLVEFMLTESDNIIAECLARQVALARNQPASFDGAAAAARTVLGELGLAAAEDGLVDGSGLARTDRVTPELLAGLLALATRPDQPRLRALFAGLPVAGYSGTLRDRYRSPGAGGSAAGLVRAKTGTLRGVSSIAGLVVDADGRALTFAVLADQVATGGTAPAQQALDRITAALAACGCR